MNYQHLDGEDAVQQISKNQSWKIIDYVYIAMKLKNEREKMVLRLYDNAQAEDLLKEQAAATKKHSPGRRIKLDRSGEGSWTTHGSHLTVLVTAHGRCRT